MPAPWVPNLKRSPSSCTPEVPKSWTTCTLADEDSKAFCSTLPEGTMVSGNGDQLCISGLQEETTEGSTSNADEDMSSRSGSSGSDGLERFVSGGGQGDLAAEQVRPDLLTQTSFHMPKSWGALPETPPKDGTAHGIRSPPQQAQTASDSHIEAVADVQVKVEQASSQQQNSHRFCPETHTHVDDENKADVKHEQPSSPLPAEEAVTTKDAELVVPPTQPCTQTCMEQDDSAATAIESSVVPPPDQEQAEVEMPPSTGSEKALDAIATGNLDDTTLELPGAPPLSPAQDQLSRELPPASPSSPTQHDKNMLPNPSMDFAATQFYEHVDSLAATTATVNCVGTNQPAPAEEACEELPCTQFYSGIGTQVSAAADSFSPQGKQSQKQAASDGCQNDHPAECTTGASNDPTVHPQASCGIASEQETAVKDAEMLLSADAKEDGATTSVNSAADTRQECAQSVQPAAIATAEHAEDNISEIGKSHVAYMHDFPSTQLYSDCFQTASEVPSHRAQEVDMKDAGTDAEAHSTRDAGAAVETSGKAFGNFAWESEMKAGSSLGASEQHLGDDFPCTQFYSDSAFLASQLVAVHGASVDNVPTPQRSRFQCSTAAEPSQNALAKDKEHCPPGTQECDDFPCTQLYSGATIQPTVSQEGKSGERHQQQQQEPSAGNSKNSIEKVHADDFPSTQLCGGADFPQTQCRTEEPTTGDASSSSPLSEKLTPGASSSSLKSGKQRASRSTASISSRGKSAPSTCIEAEPSTITPDRPDTSSRKRDRDSVEKERQIASQASHARSLGHTLAPIQQGARVAVVGDGWGSRDGGYEAIVTEADHYTYTVIATTGDHPWAENHVLKEHCIFLGDASDTKGEDAPSKCKAGAASKAGATSAKTKTPNASKRQRCNRKI